ncbi:glycoside hydrolase family 3 N-terminal domain-containing protein [Paenibacillus sp. UMB4589-SE434]|uniref:glycoside hydrolase family 3 N-terminal domain-containing protein n=1 Tax=Paenibacillus sp. UMB4589-SE434 TaxID=3046314 RepID=UPI00254FE028|nr:glycoside hydrolase family 3 N-terminal domain-containing protein [Paenibacillus sp. UMB4589-SE434]MDK8179864.1 glycoside hydrolase family 3 N-terminal domain-containing protein [Paenibacillus sp. UMB4589-SE434]
MNNQQLTALLQQMTLEEKVAQLLQLTAHLHEGAGSEGQVTGPMEEMGITEQMVSASGSVLGLSGAKAIINVQQNYLEKSRLGIPLMFMADVVHGFKTIFPIPLAIGCSWDVQLAEKSAAIAAKESAVSGIHVTFAPMVDLVRDPRWGRVMETTGEDPYLNSLFARAFVRGYQGQDELKENTDRMAACVKHFAAYGAPEGGREYNTVDMSERQLREYYLPAYKAALDEGCEMVMSSFNTVDGIPATGNEKLMRGILRDEWGFEGVIISDWASIREMIAHGAAADDCEAAYRAMCAGIDIEMMTPCYVRHLPELVQSGQIEEALIDEAVLRILQLKAKLGLFDNPFRGADPERENEVLFCEEHRQASYDLAAKSCVLLKNDHVLPLQPDTKVALIGPFADSDDILGWWSCVGLKEDATKLSTALAERMQEGSLRIAAGCSLNQISTEHVSIALEAAQSADVIVLALGEDSAMSGEGGSRTDIHLPAAQLELIKQLKTLGKPMAAVIFNGRPLDLHGVIDEVDAVLEAWYPGSEGGAVVADILLGHVNPSGRLTMSFPQSVGQVPVYYNHFNTGRPLDPLKLEERYVSKYIDSANEPLLPFGFGLSYTTFAYSELSLSNKEMTVNQPLSISVKVTNTGLAAGVETVQLYVRDVTGEVVRPLRELKGYEQLELAPGESRVATFQLTEDQLRYHHSDLRFTSDPGTFHVYVGANSRDTLMSSFTLV